MKGRPLSYWQGGSSFRTFCRIRPVVPSLKRSCRKEARHARRSGSCKAKGFPRPALFRSSSQAGHSGSPSPGIIRERQQARPLRNETGQGRSSGKGDAPENPAQESMLGKMRPAPSRKTPSETPIQKASGKNSPIKTSSIKPHPEKPLSGRRFFLARISRQQRLPCACCRSRGLCPARFHSRQAQFLNNLWQVRTENAF